MSEGTTMLTIWKQIIIKILVLLLFPISITFSSDMIGYASSLFFFDSFNGFVMNGPYSILTVFVFATPGILFYRYMLLNPISSSIIRRAVMSSIVVGLGPLPYSIIFQPFSMVMSTVYLLPFVIISLFIFLPILQRELVIRSTPMKMRNLDFAFLSRSFKQAFGKQRFLPILLWSGLLFSPFLFLYQFAEQQFFMSVIYQIQWTSYFEAPVEYFFSSLNFMLTDGFSLQPVLLMSSLRFFFVGDIFKFKDGTIGKTRLVSVALLGEITPFAIISIFSFQIYPIYFYSTPLFSPFPLFPLIGFLFLRLCKITPIRETLWDDEEHQMWFDGDASTLSPIQQPMQEGIKIPITYMIVSQIRRLRKH